ncbi:MAG: hypothetical protein IT440_07050 [Phycisphaeraceae bacterium]|nr:hypothetical protein [Phycisphaeraceae bacterium]
MARARTGSSSGGMIWAVVVFAFGFVICLVLAIIFATQIKAAKQNEAAAVKSLDQFATAGERREPDIVEITNGTSSVVGVFRDEITRLKQIITGSATSSLDAIKDEMSKLSMPDGQTLMREIRRLRAEEDAAKDLASELTKKYEAANRRADQSETAKNQVEKDYRGSVESLQKELAELKKAAADYEKKVAASRATLEQQFKGVRDDLQQQRTNSESILAQKDSEIDMLKKRLQSIESSRRSPLGGQVNPATLADGQIDSVLPDQGRVYINIGLTSRLIPGITFEVFSRKTGVETDPTGTLRGKATIEITNVFDTYSVARIVRINENTEIFEGDIIANAVYDPRMTMTFFVFGDFDIDHFGQSMSIDKSRIENMIVKWGGQLAAPREASGDKDAGILPFDLDFLVLGEAPKKPETLSKDEIDPGKIEANAEAVRKYDRYFSLVSEAKGLSIPVLNQNRFLTMVGYYKR